MFSISPGRCLMHGVRRGGSRSSRCGLMRIAYHLIDREEWMYLLNIAIVDDALGELLTRLVDGEASSAIETMHFDQRDHHAGESQREGDRR